jgi:predicted RNA polymerase sigma factor
LRVHGDLRHSLGQIEAAEADYQAAVGLARSIGAKVFIQRALSSLAGLQQSGEARRAKDARN